MEHSCARWHAVALQVTQLGLLKEGRVTRSIELLQDLNSFVYPVEGITSEDAETVVRSLVDCRDNTTVVELGQLVSSLLTQQKLSLSPPTRDRLLEVFLVWLPHAHPPVELLYATAGLTQAGAEYSKKQAPEKLLSADSFLLTMAHGGRHYDTATQRAALHYISVLCSNGGDLPQPLFHALLETLLQQLLTPSQTSDTLMQTKVLLSLLRSTYAILQRMTALHTFKLLPTLLATLKANMALGLPGQPKTISSIQPPLNVPRVTQVGSPKPQSVAGPHQRRRHRNKPRERGHSGKGQPPTPGSGSSDNELSDPSVSASHVPSLDSHPNSHTQSLDSPPTSHTQSLDSPPTSHTQRSGPPPTSHVPSLDSYPTSHVPSLDSHPTSHVRRLVPPTASHVQRLGPPSASHVQRLGPPSASHVRRLGPPSLAHSSSDSDFSDTDATPSRMRAVNIKVRHQAHSCLITIFKSLDRHTVFSYWLSLLPDGPRPHPSLLSCILKDPAPKCRGAAASVLSALLDGSKHYLAAADDRPRPSQPFTPYSSTLGNVLRELHRSLLLALAAETHHTTTTQIIKCISLLVANTPYHQLSSGYIRRITTGLKGFTAHGDADVHVSCLTCYGAIVSIQPPLEEVEVWMAKDERPWIVQHCCSILQAQKPLSLQTEALQVLTAVPKFYFQSISQCWEHLRDLYLNYLVSVEPALQQHTLKMLEELCRALPPSPPTCHFWQQLLSGPLTALLQDSSSTAICSEACNVLSTIGPNTLQSVTPPAHAVVLTLPLGLSRDENASTTVVASAVRVLGVFIQYDCLKEDLGFLVDCHSSILHTITSSNLPVRVQAAWALGNLTDSLSSLHTVPSSLIPPLYDAACTAMRDNERVKCNGVRAAGNLLKVLTEDVLVQCGDDVEKTSTLLAKCVKTGSMKSRWNACYASHSGLANPLFISKCSSSTEILSALCVAVQTCKNFKVRSNAALALGAPHSYGAQFQEVWSAVVQGLENSEQQSDFSEFKHVTTLRTQLCCTVCHMLSVMGREQAVSSLPQTAERHLQEFLTNITQEGSAASSDTVNKEVHDAARNLESLNLSSLLEMFQSVLVTKEEEEKTT